jgi:D-alanine-D-alanine ligase
VPAAGEPVLLEINTMPGMTPTSLFPDAAREAGIPFEELVALLIERAQARRARVA